MEFAITQESNLEGEKTKVVQDLSNGLEMYFKDKDYGEDVSSFIIHLICVKPEFDSFFKVRKPRYIKDKTEIIDGEPFYTRKHYSYDIKLNYETFISISYKESLTLLIDEIVRSLSHLDSLPKAIRDFNTKEFKNDLLDYIRLH